MKEYLTEITLSSQLKCPTGEFGRALGEQMYESNRQMIYSTIDLIPLTSQDSILEMGFGNGQHLNYLFAQEQEVHYLGLETSAVMLTECANNNLRLIQNGNVELALTPENELVIDHNYYFNHFFSVNTFYFWQQPLAFLNEIYNRLLPNGTLTLTLIQKEFALKQPFIDHDFVLYTPEEIKELLLQTGFLIPKVYFREEDTVSKINEHVRRPYWIIQAIK